MHKVSAEDKAFESAFFNARLQPEAFTHAQHLRLAYVTLSQYPFEEAHARIRDAIKAFLRHHNINETHYHETLTRAWLMAVRHFMMQTPHSASAQAFMQQHPQLLSSSIMLTHYSKERLFSDKARREFVTPDLQAIPHDA